jgi:hypothetical protein
LAGSRSVKTAGGGFNTSRKRARSNSRMLSSGLLWGIFVAKKNGISCVSGGEKSPT